MSNAGQEKNNDVEENSISKDLDAFKISYPDQGLLRKKRANQDKLVKVLGVTVVLLTIVVMIMAIKMSQLSSLVDAQYAGVIAQIESFNDNQSN